MDKNDIRNKDLEYVYDLEQMQFYAFNKMIPIGKGYNKNSKSVYLVFSKERTKDVFKKWYEICKNRKIKQKQINDKISTKNVDTI